MTTALGSNKNVFGWGVDADKKIRPNYPMWKPAVKGTGAHWDVPEQQKNFNDFYSIERPGPTHVFGHTVAPKGLSGLIRKFAFKYSEGSWTHWMALIFADRVNVFEGIFDDIRHGTRPRFLLERGWRMDKKFRTKRFKRVITLTVAAIAVAAGAITMSL
jgi:hypothetical protein